MSSKKDIFNVKGFLSDTQQTLLAPKDYFSGMGKTGGYLEPVIKAVLYGIIAGLINFAFMGMMGAVQIVMQPIGAALALFIGAVIVLILSLICGGSKDYQANVRVVAALMVMFPISTFVTYVGLKFVDNYYVYAALTGVVSLYSIYLLFNALTYALNGQKMRSMIVCGLFVVLTIFMGMSTWSKTAFMVGKMATDMNQYQTVPQPYDQPYGGLN